MTNKLQNFVERHSLFLFFLILLIGIYSRVRLIFDKTFPFTYDIGRDLLALDSMVHQLDIPLIGPTTGLPGLFYGPWWYYSLVPAFIVGGGSPQIINLFMALTGIIVIIVGFLIGKKVSGKAFGLILAVLLAFSPSLIAAATQIWNPNIAPMYLIIIFLILTLVVKSKKPLSMRRESLYIIALGLLAGLNIDSEVVYGLILSFALFVFLSFSLFKKNIVKYLLFILGVLIIFAPRIIFELRHDFIMTRTITAMNHAGSDGIVSIIPNAFINALTALSQLWDLTIGIQSPLLASILGLGAIGVVFYYFRTYSESHRFLLKYSLISLLIYLISLSFFQGDIWGHYIVGVPIFLLFIFATACWTLWRRKKLILLGAVVLFFVLISQFDPAAMYSYYTLPQPPGNASLYKNQEQVIDYVYQESHGKKFNEIVYTPPVHDYTYQYLFRWFGKKKYHYLPSTSKESLLFVILEPDIGYEGRLRDWLDARKDDGKIVKEKTFPSGILVQTRLH